MAKVKYAEFREAPKKVRKKRKPMTEEQRAAAVERLAKARELRAQNNPPKHTGIHPDVVALPDDNTLSMVKVKEWIKTNREQLSELKRQEKSDTKGAAGKVASLEGYIRNMEAYLKSSVWIDDFYGEQRQTKIGRVCVAMAYNKDGTPKRTVGTYYADIDQVWGEVKEEVSV